MTALPQSSRPPALAPTPTPASTPTLRHIVLCAATGLLTGLVAVAFRRCLDLVSGLRAETADAVRAGSVWGLVALGVGAGAIGWLLGWSMRRFAPECAGSGIPHVEAVLAQRRVMRWRRVLPAKFFGGVTAVGIGLSLGREGPTVQMGAAIAQSMNSLRPQTPESLRALIACGAGAGLAAAFNAPLAGLAFVFEELRRVLAGASLLGAMTSAVAAVLVTTWLLGGEPIIDVGRIVPAPEPLVVAAPALVVWSVLAGVAAGTVGALFNVAIVTSTRVASLVPRRHAPFLPALACALAALVAVRLPDAVGDGLAVVNDVLRWSAKAWSALAILATARFAMTVVSYGCGAPGGIFAPLLLIGALVGALTGHAVAALDPSMAAHEQVFGLLGMAAVFTASVRAPLTGVLLIVEMSNDAHAVLALAVASAAAFLVAEALRSPPIYESLLAIELERDE
ncbi:MAG: H(+)/Cl(-) exchange transporter ClcA [Phycisphaerales bacterium]